MFCVMFCIAPIPINDYSNGRLMGFDSIYNVYVALGHQK